MNIIWIDNVVRTISNIGKTDAGGSNRLGFTDSDIRARDYFISLIKDAGLTPKIDGFGNIFARFEGSDKSAPAVATGSHIDSVPNGGHYDGVLGAVASLAAIKQIKEDGTKLKHSIELMVFQLEESSRFGHATMGSKVVTGKDITSWNTARDKDGISIADTLKSAGFDFELLHESKREAKEFKAFVELHIDQSTDLEMADKAVGIVEAIAAPIRSKVTINGEAAHSGGAKMKYRKDALISAAELILAVRNFALAYSDKKIVATVGNIKVYPGAMNVVPGKSELFIDLRGTDINIMEEVYGLIKDESSKIAMRHGTPVEIELLSKETPVLMDQNLFSIIKTVCRDLNIPYEKVVSGAGHDAMNMAALTPACMIFVRGRKGVSHHPEEFAAPEDIEKGFLVLTETLKRLAE